VTEVAANPPGTGPPVGGTATVAAGEAVAECPAAAGVVGAADEEVAPPVPDAVPPKDDAVPQPASASAVSSAPERIAAPDVRERKLFFTPSKTLVGPLRLEPPLRTMIMVRRGGGGRRYSGRESAATLAARCEGSGSWRR